MLYLILFLFVFCFALPDSFSTVYYNIVRMSCIVAVFYRLESWYYLKHAFVHLLCSYLLCSIIVLILALELMLNAKKKTVSFQVSRLEHEWFEKVRKMMFLSCVQSKNPIKQWKKSSNGRTNLVGFNGCFSSIDCCGGGGCDSSHSNHEHEISHLCILIKLV